MPRHSAKRKQSRRVEIDKPRIPFRSALIPFTDDIRRWRKQGKTYSEIAELLERQFNLKVHKDTINSFVLVRARRRKVAELPDEGGDEGGDAEPVTHFPAEPASSSRKTPAGKRNPPDVVHSDQYPPAKPDRL